MTVSVGVASYPAAASTAEALLTEADARMYQVKRSRKRVDGRANADELRAVQETS